MKPLTERPGADRYRGFHQNDLDKCIGCGSCETICQNGAIDMVEVAGQDIFQVGVFMGLKSCEGILGSSEDAFRNRYIYITEEFWIPAHPAHDKPAEKKLK